MSITVDKVQLEIAIKHDKARQEIAEITDKLQGETKQLKELEKAKKKAMKKYKDESHPEVVKATLAYEEQSKKINALKARKDELRRSLKVEGLSIAEVRDELKKYNMQLANLTPGTEKFNETKKHVDELTVRLKELKSTTDQTKESLGKFGGGNMFDGLKKTLGAKLDFGQLKTFIMGSGIVSVATFLFDTVADLASRAFDRVKSLVTESVQAARAAEGITHAFQRLDQPGLLQNLRRATHGTVTDLELMKAAVQANDFRLPLDQLGKYLEFAQLKAQQTGQSVDYMTNSIVTGLGRKSPQILDNLGISAAEIKEEMQKTGDMATAVGNIIDRQLADAGEHFEDAAEREARATTDVANAQLQLGQQMQKTFGIGSTSFGEMQAKAEVFILNGLTKTILYLQQLYDRMTSVRLVVEGVKVVFNTFFKVVQAGFYLLIDSVRIFARTLSDAGQLVESLFEAIKNRSTDPITHAWEKFTTNFERGYERMGRHLKDVGTKWGENIIDSMNAVTGKKKVKAPQIEPPARPAITTPTVSSGTTTAGGSSSGGKGTAQPLPTANDDPYKQQLAAREQALKEYQNSLRQMLLHQLLTEEEYHQESTQAELKFLADKMVLQDQYGRDTADTLTSYLDKSISEAKRQHTIQLQQEQEAARQLQEQQQAAQQVMQNFMKNPANSFASMSEFNEQLMQKELISYQQYQDNKEEIARAAAERRQQIEQLAFDNANQLLNSASALFTALQQREVTQVEAKYKNLISAAKKQGRDTTKLEEQKEQETLDIKKRYAQKEFKLKVLQIIASTAQAIANVWREWSAMPAVAAALSVVAAAAGAVQLVQAKSAQEQAAGLYQGGYTEGYTANGNPRDEAGVIPVHKNEFVANHLAVANPAVRPVLDVIDRHQRIGDVRMLNTTRLLEEAYGQGRYRGGYASPTGGAPAGSAAGEALQGPGAPAATADDILPLLRRIERNTATSITLRDLRREIRHEEQLEQNARR